ncbi:N-acetylglucosamine kinase [Saccharibacillus alkalitolerans]|uniref:ATPase n=1 Tax=Saccharibacillus alkalitolerans TaxID=2705290 RepID=A0ABX0F703_9BACL|nr:BadF/BadG/BcrA/BcrD ATPase family protein [Saccharibacillus alkalitolerans]NGZ76746.1 ATPase [Saccharibacillus alkalitolerans]
MLAKINADSVVAGVDMGGTNIRIMLADLAGNVQSYVKAESDLLPKQRTDNAPLLALISEALERAGRHADDVAFLAAGIAGLDDESDRSWADRLAAGFGLPCPCRVVNDALIAHRGALAGAPGILIASGTGSILLAHTERGQWLRNYDFGHYAASGARFLGYQAVYDVLAGRESPGDGVLVRDMLRFFRTPNLRELAESASRSFGLDPARRDRLFGLFAPVVTREAEAGSPIAVRVCDEALRQIGVGADMLAAFFDGPDIPISQTGSVAGSPYFLSGLRELVCAQPGRRFDWTEPRLTPAAGAVLIAYESLGLSFGESMADALESSPHARL